MKTFTVHVRCSYHHRFPVTVRASDMRHAKRKAARRAGLVPFDWNGVEQGGPEVMFVDGPGVASGEPPAVRARRRFRIARRACALMLKASMRGDELQTEYALDLAAQVIGKAAYLALRHECGLPACDTCGELCICGEGG